ncbi:MAG TPA: acetyltransferase [Phycisphaerales bacterium]|nr:acetyltransferase [Phycisphaerales bacterium]
MTLQHEITSLVIIGGGGHGLVVAESAGLGGLRVAGFLDDDAGAVLGRLGGVPHVGGLDALGVGVGPPGWLTLGQGVIIGLGGLSIRRRVIDRLAGAGLDHRVQASVLSLAAYISPTAVVGLGTFVGPGAVVHAHAKVGVHCIVNTTAVVEHECVLGENVHIAPGAVLGGNVHIGEDTLIGLGSRVLPGVKIGRGCVIGAGAVVTRDVGDGKKVVGVPGTAR